MAWSRKIIHIDMDAFFASIEQRDDQSLKGKPIVVGGSPEGRGVVSAASYEARKFGIRSAQSCKEAYRLCPKAIFIKPRMDIYRHVSRTIMGIFREYTSLVEPLSLDEAFLDVSSNRKYINDPSELAHSIKSRIKRDTDLTASAGVAPNKFLAKIASDLDKPDGLVVIAPEHVEDILPKLSVRKIPGIGDVTEKKMARLGIFNVSDLRERTERELIENFGKSGRWYYKIARGIDDRKVESERIRKSVGAETTFERDITDIDIMKDKLKELCYRVSNRLGKLGACGKTITLKITYPNFEKVTRSETLPKPVFERSEIEKVVVPLLSQTDAGERAARLLGVSVSNLENDERKVDRQLELTF